MHPTIVAAIITASTTIFIALIVPLVRWLIEVRLGENPPPTRRYKALKIGFYVTCSVIGLGIVSTSILYYISAYEYSSIAPDLVPAWSERIQSNGTVVLEVKNGLDLPKQLHWLKFTYDNSDNIIPSDITPQINYSDISHFLYYDSYLHTKQYSWTGLFIWYWCPLFCSPKIDGKSEIILIIHAQDEDRLEIGVKDTYGNEQKVPLKVNRGWFAYRIPFAYFNFVDFSSIRLFLVAHSRGVGSIDRNRFKIALFGVQ